MRVKWARYFQICSADAEYPTILAASRALHGPLPPDFTEHVHCIGGLALESHLAMEVSANSQSGQRLEDW